MQLPRGAPLGVEPLAVHGITAKRASALVRSGWLQRLGRGAYQLPGDTLNREACLAFLAQQLPGGHVAAKTALAWHGVRHNLSYRETVVFWGDQPARLPGWLDVVVPVRYRVAHIFDPDLPAGLGLAPLTGGHAELPVSSPERALLELLNETGSFESLEEVRQLVESTRNLRLPLLDQLLATSAASRWCASPPSSLVSSRCPGQSWPSSTAAASAVAAAGWPLVAPGNGWIWRPHDEQRLHRQAKALASCRL